MSHQPARRLLAELLDRSVQVWTVSGEPSEPRLSFRAPRGTLDAGLQAELRAAKGELIALLRPGCKYAPPSFAQERLFFLDRLEERGDVDNAALAWQLEGPPDRAALAAAIGDLALRHEPLRTVFAEFEGRVAQIVEPPRPLSLQCIDLSSLSREPAVEMAGRAAARLARVPFDLRRGPLLHAYLFRLSDRVHRLLLVLHHISTDGWSTAIVERELGALYAARLERRPDALPPLTQSYADHAVAQRLAMRGEPLLDHLAFWRTALAPPLPVLELPFDRPHPPRRRYRGGGRSFSIDDGVARRLDGVARRAGASLYMTLLAAFAVLLRRLTGQDDFVVGSPIAGRERQEDESLIGFFINMLALRPRVGGRQSFDGLLREIRETVLAAFAHQELPFEKLAEEIGERDLRRPPIFQVSFVLQSAPTGHLDLSGLESRAIEVGRHHSPYELSLHCQRRERDLVGRAVYDPDLFDATTVERWMRTFLRLLRQVAERPGLEVGSWPLLSSAEHHQVTVEWSDGGAAEDLGACLHELVARRAALDPEAAAVEHDGAAMSYGELARRARRVARILRRRGAAPGRKVAICAEPSFELVAGLFAILEAGGAFLSLEPGHPTIRLASMLHTARPTLILAGRRWRDALPATPVPVVVFEEAEAEEEGSVAHSTEIRVSPDHPAYVLFTSGSTGLPKGIEVSHRAYGRYLAWRRRTLRPAPGERILHKGSLLFDGTLWEIFEPLTTGGTVVIAPRDTGQNPELLAHALDESRIDAAGFVPPLLALSAEASPAWLAGLRRLTVSGEPLPRSLARRLAEVGVHAVNLYGPAEAVAASTFWRCERLSADSGEPPIGRPVAGRRVYVLDAGGRPRPIGAAGEIHLGGSDAERSETGTDDGLARGYLGDPRATAAGFRPDPWNGRGGRLYCSGDRGRFRADGELEFLGRRDHQVQIRGLRFELGEIETALAAHPAVARAAVAFTQIGGEARLCAWVEARDSASLPDRDGWDELLAARLPPAAWPGRIEVVDRWPLSPAGKIDRPALEARLPEIFDRDAVPETVSPATPGVPRDALERTIAEVFGEVLDVDGVSGRDSFFELGGHSLLATRVTARLADRLETGIALRTLFENSTPRRLADALIRGHGSPRAAPPDREIPHRDPDTPAELSFVQERLWFLERLEGGAAYHMSLAWRLDGPLDTARLEAAFEALLNRHEVWRTVFPETPDGRPAAVIGRRDERSSLLRVDLSGLPRGRRHRESRLRRRREAARPFDLAAGPLLRALLLHCETRRHVLQIDVHHIVSDGISQRLLKEELAELYAAALEGREPRLGEPLLQYSDFAAWQRRILAPPRLGRLAVFWRRRLLGVETLELPSDRPRGVSPRRGAACRLAPLSAPRAAALRRLAHAGGATLHMTFLAAAFVLLHRLQGTGGSVIGSTVIGTPVAGRPRPELERVAGCFVNLLPITVRGDQRDAEDLGFKDWTQRVRDSMLAALAHQEMPFDRLVEELAPRREPGRHPFFQVTFDLQSAAEENWSLAGTKAEELEPAAASARFDLEFHLFEEGAAGHPDERWVEGAFFYDASLFDSTTVARWSRSWDELLNAITDGHHPTLGDLPLLAAAERHQMIIEWNDTGLPRIAETGQGDLLHRLIEDRAARSPTAPALIWESGSEVETMSYGELSRRAMRRAHRLRAHGAGPERRVAVLLDRTPELPVTLLAVLRTGAAFVPLDPELPSRRLARLIRDARPRVIVSQEQFRHAVPAGLEAAWIPVDDSTPSEERSGAAEQPMPAVHPANMAYVIHTSGSSGQPKGVAVSHRAIVRHLSYNAAAFPLSCADRVIHKTPAGFDVAVWEIFWPWLCGAALVVARPDGHRDPEYLAELALRQGATVIHFVPSLLPAFLDTAAERGLAMGGRLRSVICGGEELPATTARNFGEVLPQADLHNCYGPTEAAVGITAWSLYSGTPVQSGARIPIGRPVDETRLFVLGTGMRLAPLGCPGELWAGGTQLARGYLDRPAATAERFVPDRFSASPGERLYRTGDRCRQRPDGALVFLGRVDHQVKIRGRRVELGEIESALNEQAELCQAVVGIANAADGMPRLVAWIVAADGTPDLNARLRERLAESLPPPLVPAAFVRIPALPRTPSGKIDRAALPEPGESDLPGSRPAGVPPRDPIEQTLAQIFSRVLGLTEAGAEDDFFALGGDSISSLQVVSRARRAGIELTPRDLFTRPTVAGLAALARQRETESVSRMAPRGPTSTGPMPVAPRPGPVPLTRIQQRFLDSGLPDPWHFNQALLLTAPQVSPRRLATAAVVLARRHDALRLRFRQRGGGWEQWSTAVDDRQAAASAAIIDLARLDAASGRAALERATAALQSSLDLERGPLFRLAHFWRADNSANAQRLFVVIHHLAVDAASWPILIEDLERLCRGLDPPVPSPSKTSFATWARHTPADDEPADVSAGADDSPGAAGGFLSTADSTAAGLPIELGGRNSLRSVTTVSAALDAEATRHLLERTAKSGFRVDQILIAALALALTEWSGQERLSLQIEGHGRGVDPAGAGKDGFDLTHTVGWFTVLRTVELTVELPWELALAAKIRWALDAPPARSLDGAAPVSFNYLGRFTPWESAGGRVFGTAPEAPGPSRGQRGERHHLLELNGGLRADSPGGERIEMLWTYSSMLHHRTTVTRLAERHLAAVRRLVDQLEFVEDVYPLTPLQVDFVKHSLAAPAVPVYVEQASWEILGPFDNAAFRRAWEALVGRYSALRTAIARHGGRWVQIVSRQVPLPYEFRDERHAPWDDAKLADFHAAERRRGFDLERAPLFRVVVLCLADDIHRFVWTLHHVLLDGWSVQRLLAELLALFDAFAKGEGQEAALPPPAFRTFVERRLTASAAASAFWHRELDGWCRTRRPTARPPLTAAAEPLRHTIWLRLPRSTTGALEAFARRHRLTLHTLVQGAWALTLLDHGPPEEREVLFGGVVADRPADLPGAEEMVGLMINILPVRVEKPTADDATPPAVWLRRLQERQAEARRHVATPLDAIHGAAGVAPGESLYDSLVFFQNFPPLLAERGPGVLRFSRFEGWSHFPHPLVLTAMPGRRLALRASFDPAWLGTEIEERMSRLRGILEGWLTVASIGELQEHA